MSGVDAKLIVLCDQIPNMWTGANGVRRDFMKAVDEEFQRITEFQDKSMLRLGELVGSLVLILMMLCPLGPEDIANGTALKTPTGAFVAHFASEIQKLNRCEVLCCNLCPVCYRNKTTVQSNAGCCNCMGNAQRVQCQLTHRIRLHCLKVMGIELIGHFGSSEKAADALVQHKILDGTKRKLKVDMSSNEEYKLHKMYHDVVSGSHSVRCMPHGKYVEPRMIRGDQPDKFGIIPGTNKPCYQRASEVVSMFVKAARTMGAIPDTGHRAHMEKLHEDLCGTVAACKENRKYDPLLFTTPRRWPWSNDDSAVKFLLKKDEKGAAKVT